MALEKGSGIDSITRKRLKVSSRRKDHSRVFVLALDGATFDVINPWMQAGHLPNLRDLLESGAYGDLESTYPPLTGPAWASFMTGKKPINHGVLEFFQRAPGSYNQILYTRRDIDGRSIWRVLSDAGKRVGVVGVPLTYPPETVNGFLVTGLLTPRRPDVTFTYPPELGEELKGQLGGYLLQRGQTYSRSPTQLLKEESAILSNLVDATRYLVDSKDWDFFVMHILGTDVVQHALWHYMDPTHPLHEPKLNARYGDPVLGFWKRVDEHLGCVLEGLTPDDYVLVMSDHGFGPVKKLVNFNVWLLRHGFLRLESSFRSKLRYFAFKLGYNYKTIAGLSSRLGFVGLAHRLGRGRRETLQRRMFLSLKDVDWPRTQVYSIGNFGQMYVNLKGREPLGCVSPGIEYEQVLQRLEKRLRALRDPETAEPVIAKIWRGSDLFQGKYAGRAPDLFFFTADMKYKAMGLTDFGSSRVFDGSYGTYAHHRMNGLFILCGPGVRRGEQIEGARLIDLAPTIYALMGVPIPQDLDGQFLTQAFLPGHEVAFRFEADAVDDFRPQAQEVYSSAEEAQVTEHLRSLGYVD